MRQRTGPFCASLDHDPLNCGSCETHVFSGQLCVAGACSATCPAGQTVCGGACANPLTDNQNCGGCSQLCAAGGLFEWRLLGHMRPRLHVWRNGRNLYCAALKSDPQKLRGLRHSLPHGPILFQAEPAPLLSAAHRTLVCWRLCLSPDRQPELRHLRTVCPAGRSARVVLRRHLRLGVNQLRRRLHRHQQMTTRTAAPAARSARRARPVRAVRVA